MDEGYDAVNIARAHDIAAGRPLAVLPPEALELRSSRARSGHRKRPWLDDRESPGRAGRVSGAGRLREFRGARALLVLLGLLALAAVLRLAVLDTRGTWDADQGHDMSVLRALVRDGAVPLLGPPTSIGDVHHGALYYYILLAPAAALTGGDSPSP